MKLHCFGESGNAYKAALTLELAGVAWQPVWVDFFGGATRSPEFRALNPMGEVPVLEDEGLVLTQSAVIQLHCAERTGRFLGERAQERQEVLRWLFWDNHKLSALAGSTRFLMNFLPEHKRPDAVIAFQQARLGASYKVLDQHLGARDWIVGAAPSLADFACCGYLFYPEPFGFNRAEWPAIDRWLDRIEGLPGWKHPYDLMPGSPADRT
ncbi:glutathione S-transferase [Roseinatronobacter thiooxidans]|uniref:Glutathione S-transferase n=1 Tax=Roseinatronobacter thiooxidans TaxID=121821 RepID=A0A2W7QM65_9RHOB|nr:glutathione S-transferase [Roseinatronobacter thiooxidans]PZX47160.1 glutathione S-transferase [Roseinatronobacter thiooxidans]